MKNTQKHAELCINNKKETKLEFLTPGDVSMMEFNKNLQTGSASDPVWKNWEQ